MSITAIKNTQFLVKNPTGVTLINPQTTAVQVGYTYSDNNITITKSVKDKLDEDNISITSINTYLGDRAFSTIRTEIKSTTVDSAVTAGTATTLTGNVASSATATTQLLGDSSTKVATTAFVADAVATASSSINSHAFFTSTIDTISSGQVLTFPSSAYYIVGNNQLLVTIDGAIWYKGKQYTETNSSSITFTVDFDSTVARQFEVGIWRI